MTVYRNRLWVSALLLALPSLMLSGYSVWAQAGARSLIALTLSTGTVLVCEVRQEASDYIKVYDLRLGEEVQYSKAPGYRRFVANTPRPKGQPAPRDKNAAPTTLATEYEPINSLQS